MRLDDMRDLMSDVATVWQIAALTARAEAAEKERDDLKHELHERVEEARMGTVYAADRVIEINHVEIRELKRQNAAMREALSGARTFIVHYVNHKCDMSDFIAGIDATLNPPTPSPTKEETNE